MRDERRQQFIKQNDNMIIWALDENGCLVHANDAVRGKGYRCPGCDTLMHVSRRGDTKFFVCKVGKPHENGCPERGKRIHRDLAVTDPEDLIAGLLKPSKAGPPTGGHGPAGEPREGVYPCTSLAHVYEAGFHIHPPKGGMVGAHRLERFVITEHNAWVIMNNNASLAGRVVFAKPDGYDKEQLALRFVVYAGGRLTQKKVFLLVFGKEFEEEFRDLRYKLCFAPESSNIEAVLIAADWLEASLPMCEMVCDKKCPDPKWECTGMQVGHYKSKRQIYIPKPKKKTK